MVTRFKKPKHLLLATVFLSVIVLNNCSIVFPIVAPFSDLPEPTGTYGVATRTATWTDSSRDETFTEANDFRRIVVQVWYPAMKNPNAKPLNYIDDPDLRLPAISKQLRLPVSLFKHFVHSKTNSISASPIESSDGEFPVILFSHGLSGMRFQNTALMEDLASHGYVVLAADHSYEANITIFDNGETAEYRAGKRRALNDELLQSIDLSQLYIVVDDLRFMLDKIENPKSETLLKALPYRKENIGIMGHSLGGAAAINTMAIDERISSTMVLDGWYTPVPDSVILSGVHKPIFHIGQKEWSDPGNYIRMDQLLANSSGAIFKVLIPGTMHTDFTDMPLFTPFSHFIGYTAIDDPDRLNALLRKSALRFFDAYLKGHPVADLKFQISSEQDVTSYIFIPNAP